MLHKLYSNIGVTHSKHKYLTIEQLALEVKGCLTQNLWPKLSHLIGQTRLYKNLISKFQLVWSTCFDAQAMLSSRPIDHSASTERPSNRIPCLRERVQLIVKSQLG